MWCVGIAYHVLNEFRFMIAKGYQEIPFCEQNQGVHLHMQLQLMIVDSNYPTGVFDHFQV